MISTTYNSSEDIINESQRLKGKTTLKFCQKITQHYDEMNIRRQIEIFQFEEDTFAENSQGISNVYHDVFLFMKFLQTKPGVETLNFNCSDLCYNVIKKRDEKEHVNNQYEDNEND